MLRPVSDSMLNKEFAVYFWFIRFEDTFDIRRGHSAFPGFV